MAQPPGEELVTCAQIAQQAIRRMAHESRQAIAEKAAFAMQLGTQRVMNALLQLIEPLLLLAKPYARMRKRQALRGVTQSGRSATQLALQCGLETVRQTAVCGDQRLPIGHDALSGSRWRGAARVGCEVRDREIYFMADAGHDGH